MCNKKNLKILNVKDIEKVKADIKKKHQESKKKKVKEPEKLLKYKEFYIFTIMTILILVLARLLNPRLDFLLKIWG